MTVLFAAFFACTHAPGTADSSDSTIAPPDQPGSWVVGHTTDVLSDVGETGRDLPVDIWYPVEPGAEATSAPTEYPLLADIALESELAFADPPGAGIDAPHFGSLSDVSTLYFTAPFQSRAHPSSSAAATAFDQ